MRGSLLLAGLLTLWWLALRPPLFLVLRVSEEVTMGLLPGSDSTSSVISVDVSGDWNFRVPVQDTHQEPGAPPKAHTVEFTVPQDDVAVFTLSFPFFWALMLAAPGARSHVKAILWGTALVALTETLLLLGWIEISASNVMVQWRSGAAGQARWWSAFGEYLVTDVMPFFAPVAIALAVLRDLRLLVSDRPPCEPAESTPRGPGRPSQRRSEGPPRQDPPRQNDTRRRSK